MNMYSSQGKKTGWMNPRFLFRANTEQGTAVVLVMIVLVMLMSLGFGFITLTTIESSIAHNDNDYIRALYVAEAGISECMLRLNYPRDAQIEVNGDSFYPYIPVYTVTDDRGTESPVDDLYWHNDRIDNNGNGFVDEWGEIDPGWTANIWSTSMSGLPTPPPGKRAAEYNYYPTTLNIISGNMPALLRYTGETPEDRSLSLSLKKFENGSTVFIDSEGEFEQTASGSREGSPVVTIESTGRWSTIRRQLVVEAYPEIKPLFEQSICGCKGLIISGNTVTNSYSSDLGPYPAGMGIRGDVGSNTFITLDGSPVICGTLTAGTDINAGNSTVTGHALSGGPVEGGTIKGTVAESMQPAPEPCPCDVLRLDVDMEYFRKPENNNNEAIGTTDRGRDPFRGGPYHLDLYGNDNLALYDGEYYFDSITIAGNATLTVLGKVTIYLAGTSDIAGGGIITRSGLPTDLVIYSTAEIIYVASSNPFFGALYAPNAAVIMHGSSEYYGAILANVVEKTGSSGIHYDEALRKTGPKYYAGLKKISWRE